MKKEIQIKGMRCISCEVILEKEFKKISGVRLIMVSYKKGIIQVEYSEESKYKELVKIIQKNNFEVVENSSNTKKSKTLDNILGNVISIMFVIILFIASQLFEIYRFIPDTSSINYFSAILIGIIASVSTCLAVTGGIIVGFSRYFDNSSGFKGHLKVQASFQVGRIFGFFLLGGLLGYFGGFLNINFTVNAVITFVVGFLLFYMGLNILGIVPSITKYGVHMPKSFTQKIESLGNPKYSPLVGALTFFLPCGFTQTMQLLAIGSGSFWQGGLVMMFFAIGTGPVLLALGLGSSYFKGKKFSILTKIVGAIVIFFGLYTLFNSYNLIKYININPFSNNNSQIQNITDASGKTIAGSQLEEVFVKHNGYQTIPSIINLKAGGNYKITIMPSSNGLGCMSTLVVPGISNEVNDVKAGTPIFYKIYDAKPGKYSVVCASMGMTQGQIIIQ